MKELDLFRFIKDNSVEMRWDDDVLSTWIASDDLLEFANLAKSFLEGSGCEVTLCPSGQIHLNLVDVCEYYGIESERIFPK
jgi:hypothetical protein